jgi:hypothetical protein
MCGYFSSGKSPPKQGAWTGHPSELSEGYCFGLRRLESLPKELFIATSAPEGVVEKMLFTTRPKARPQYESLVFSALCKAEINFGDLGYV